MTGFSQNAQDTVRALELTPGWAALCAANGHIDTETAAAILDEAARFAQDVIAPLNTVADAVGCRIEDGRVRTPDGFAQAYAALGQNGWLGLEQNSDLGGQGLPVTMFAAVEPVFERGCPAFMMAAGSSRAAALLLDACAPADIRSDWIPALVDGRRTATICISEPEAGSDLGRIRTRAETRGDGWVISGQKIWISFGDHDMAEQIGHCILARTSDTPGSRGLSLFLVPDGGSDSAGVQVERIEEKLGLHGSATCALRFEAAPAILLGPLNTGLPQLFTMIRHMRLLTACQGLGVAMGALECAKEHAAERRQGGNPKEPAVPIDQHPDVRRQLTEMEVPVHLFRLALLEAAVSIDLGGVTGDAEACQAHQMFSTWMLPMLKSFGAELGFDTAHRAIQVLGGSGYTKDYPAEQALRDARVFAIYEGTTGMQSYDFLFRRHIGSGGREVAYMLQRARAEAVGNARANAVFDRFEILAGVMVDRSDDAAALAFAAEPFMRAAWVAVMAWMAVRLGRSDRGRDVGLAAYSLETALAKIELFIAEADRRPV